MQHENNPYNRAERQHPAGAPAGLCGGFSVYCLTAQLRRMYEQDGSLTLELNVSSPKDYMRLACFAIGDC